MRSLALVKNVSEFVRLLFDFRSLTLKSSHMLSVALQQGTRLAHCPFASWGALALQLEETQTQFYRQKLWTGELSFSIKVFKYILCK